MIVVAFIVSLNTIVADVLTEMPDAPPTGVTETTDGGVVSGAAAVVNAEANAGESGLPAASCAPVVTKIE